VLLAIGTGADLDDPKRFRFTGQESYVKSEKEMRALFPQHPETSTIRRGSRELCEFDFEKRYFVPSFPLPPAYTDENALLRDLADGGRAGDTERTLPKAVSDRLEYELSVITTAGYAGYFLIVEDFIRGRARPRHPGGAGPRLGGRVPGGLRAPDHRQSIRCDSTCSSSASSIPSGCRCRTSTSTSASSAAAR
jgi:DNA polymerase-3 subunit alpha